MNRRRFLTSSLIVSAGMASFLALPRDGAATSQESYVLPELPGYPPGNTDDAGRTQVSAALVPGEKTAVIMWFGDSLMSNTVDSLYVAKQGRNHNFNVYNGAVYQSVEPLLGCQTNAARRLSGCFATRAADMLIANSVYDRVINVPFAVGGSVFADYAEGGAINGRFGATYFRLQAAGLVPTGVFCMLGANDKNIGVSEASATASLESIISTIRAVGITCNIFIARHSRFAGVTSPAVRAAQAAVLDDVTVFSGGDMDSIPSDGYWDGTHFNADGASAAAALAVTAITAHAS